MPLHFARIKLSVRWLVPLLLAGCPVIIAAQADHSAAAHADPVIPVILALVVILTAGKLGGYLVTWLGQPPVLGELVAGVVLGSSDLAGIGWFRVIETAAGAEVEPLESQVKAEPRQADMMSAAQRRGAPTSAANYFAVMMKGNQKDVDSSHRQSPVAGNRGSTEGLRILPGGPT